MSDSYIPKTTPPAEITLGGGEKVRTTPTVAYYNVATGGVLHIPIKTNYDRIISKTPEELAQLIMSIEPAACPFRGDHGDDCRFTHCEKCWLDWLKQEADNGKD